MIIRPAIDSGLCDSALEIFRNWNDGTGIDFASMTAHAEQIDGVSYADLFEGVFDRPGDKFICSISRLNFACNVV